MGIVPDVLREKSGLIAAVGAIRESISNMYAGWRSYDVARTDGIPMAHMAGFASVRDWDSALFRTKQICAILNDDFRAHCHGAHMWINGAWQKIESFRDGQISRMEAAC